MSDSLFCEEGDADYMEDDVQTIVDMFFDGGVFPDHRQPLIVEEWAARDTRTFLRDDWVLDHFADTLCEFHLEEQMDENGHTWDRLHAAASRPEIREQFTAFLDDLFAGVNYRWADKLVARWEVRWTVPANEDDEIDMETVTYERKAIAP